MATKDKTIPLVVEGLCRLGNGDVSKFLPPEPIPGEIEHFLDSAPSIGARRAALVAILESIIDDET